MNEREYRMPTRAVLILVVAALVVGASVPVSGTFFCRVD
jgi:hypothetical protein